MTMRRLKYVTLICAKCRKRKLIRLRDAWVYRRIECYACKPRRGRK